MNTEDATYFDGSEPEERATVNGSIRKKDEGGGPACQSCRRKKAKCSRDSPCSHCDKNGLTCLYDKGKGRPGMKAGAIERLTQRLDNLENMFLGQGVLFQQIWNSLQAQSKQEPLEGTLSERTQQLKNTFDILGGNGYVEERFTIPVTNATKRRRIARDDPAHMFYHPASENINRRELPSDLIDVLVDIYFERIHPWIPILHVRQFRQHMNIPETRQKLNTILQAIVSVCIRFSNDYRLGGAAARHQLMQFNRQAVILKSMETFSVENLQALIICAFDTMGSGRGPSAWSIVGSMARTVEQLQLSIEDEDQSPFLKDAQVLVKRMQFLRPCQNWSEREERRRVFWNVFLMDRFCSIATGWNVCLTSADVARRLPCEGALWEEGNPLQTPTPYFGVSDPPSNTGGQLPTARPEADDQASLGGFAYCIEATESLSLVTSFFLQQAVDVAKAHDVQLWLVRFKQLDLRLIQWKLFLPERWREARALNDDGNMDPNLTLAHITHNTAVVLLHQGIAYPSPELRSLPIHLPSTSSAETCMTAAVEVSIIAEEFLRNTRCLTNSQFAFCLFICGRMLIAHSFHYQISLPREFDTLVSTLQDMSDRWNGFTSESNLASKFAMRLVHARQSGIQSLDMRQAAYVDDQVDGNGSELTEMHSAGDVQDMLERPLGTFGEVLPVAASQGETPDSITLAFPPLPFAFQAQSASRNATVVPSPNIGPVNGFTSARGNQEMQSGNNSMDIPPVGSLEGNIGLEDLTSFLDYSFLPEQRVSAYSSAN